jgi:hypothetical protein
VSDEMKLLVDMMDRLGNMQFELGILKRAPKQFHGTISSEPMPEVDKHREAKRLIAEMTGQAVEEAVEADYEELQAHS